MEGNESSMTEELSFLDLGDCSQETKSFLLSLIEDETKPKQLPPASSAACVISSSEVVQHPQQHFQQVYATPHVYINSVTANVNVHHGNGVSEQFPTRPMHPPPPVVSNHSGGFPPPPPNRMVFHNTALPNGNFMPQNYIYQHHHQMQQAAAMAAAKASPTAPPPPQANQSMYPIGPSVIYYPYPIPVTQQAVLPPTSAPRAPVTPNVIRGSSPISFPPNVITSVSASAEVYYPPNMAQSQEQQLVEPTVESTNENVQPVVSAAAPVPEMAISVEETAIQIEDEQPNEVKEEVKEAAPQPEEVKKEIVQKEEEKEDVNKKEPEETTKSSSCNNNGGSKSWASLFHKDTPANIGSVANKPTARIQPYTNMAESSTEEVEATKNDPSRKKNDSGHKTATSDKDLNPNDLDMATFLQNYTLNHRSIMVKPHGLSNRNNWCFVNAIMQALVACPPFYNLMKSLPSGDIMKKASMVKIIKVVQGFVSEFAPLDHLSKINRRDKGKKTEDLPLGMTFEASSIFKFLLNLTSDTFKVVDGRQEDAEEFLTFLLNELNDEMLGLLKLLVEETSEGEEEEEADEEGNDEWHEVGAKNKSLLTRRVGNSNESLRSPVGNIFQGQLQSCVQSSNGEPTATLQPFFTLPLDIQSKNIKSVSDALLHNFTAETIDGYVCSKTKKLIEASRSLYLDELPAVLILHLKRFVYDETSSGCQKLLKNIDFPVDLEIPKDILSNNSKNKYHNKQRSYKLFAVVYHNGKEASLGHYVTDVYHAGLGWLHCDDSIIKSMTENMVLAHSASSVPYILFYRRGDTMGPGGVNSLSASSSTSSTSAATATATSSSAASSSAK